MWKKSAITTASVIFLFATAHSGTQTLTLANAAAGDTGPKSAPIDIALNNNSHYLYVLVAGTQSVASFRVNKNSTLTLIDTDGGLPLGSQGIAAK